tara:strand:+ start:286 stop:957 length:672 start_codon:yes stop_codon:yes gene_type:complete
MTIIVLDICEKNPHFKDYRNCGGFNFMKLSQETKPKRISFISLYPEIIIKGNKSTTRDFLFKKICSFKDIKYIVIACHTASSCILDILIKNNHLINNIRIFEPIIPLCEYIKKKKYQTILIFSTSLTARIRWHARILKLNIKYMTFDSLPSDIDNNNIDKINNTLHKLSTHKHFLSMCDCVVLGCTHFNFIKNTISKYLQKNNFSGEIIDSNYVLHEYFKRKI